MSFSRQVYLEVDGEKDLSLLLKYRNGESEQDLFEIEVFRSTEALWKAKWSVDVARCAYIFDPSSVVGHQSSACISQCIGVAVGKGLIECLWAPVATCKRFANASRKRPLACYSTLPDALQAACKPGGQKTPRPTSKSWAHQGAAPSAAPRSRCDADRPSTVGAITVTGFAASGLPGGGVLAAVISTAPHDLGSRGSTVGGWPQSFRPPYCPAVYSRVIEYYKHIIQR